jgi:hypothetical protein
MWRRARYQRRGDDTASRSQRSAAEIHREADEMAETKKGNKIVAVPGYTRKQDGKKILVSEHRRSTPETSTGKK